MDQKEREKEYEEFTDLFAMPAWIKIQNEAHTLLETLQQNAHIFADTNDKWQFTRGRITQLDILANYEERFKEAYREMEKHAQEDEQEDDDAPVVI